MAEHVLKIDPQPFADLLSGAKTCEVRCDDRGFETGDTVQLHEQVEPGHFSGRTLRRAISHIQRGYGLPEGLCVLSYGAATPSEDGREAPLAERMKAAGMIPTAELLAGAPLDAFIAHAGVVDLETFGQWLTMKRKEYLEMQARFTLDKREDDELYEWVVAHCAVFGEVHINFRNARRAQPARQVGGETKIPWGVARQVGGDDDHLHGHPRYEHDSRDEIELFLRDAYAAGANAAHSRSLTTALDYAARHAPKLRAALAPAAVVMPERVNPDDVNDPRWLQGHGYNAALDDVARLNRRAIPAGLLERVVFEVVGLEIASGLNADATDELRALLGKDGETRKCKDYGHGGHWCGAPDCWLRP